MERGSACLSAGYPCFRRPTFSPPSAGWRWRLEDDAVGATSLVRFDDGREHGVAFERMHAGGGEVQARGRGVGAVSFAMGAAPSWNVHSTACCVPGRQGHAHRPASDTSVDNGRTADDVAVEGVHDKRPREMGYGGRAAPVDDDALVSSERTMDGIAHRQQRHASAGCAASAATHDRPGPSAPTICSSLRCSALLQARVRETAASRRAPAVSQHSAGTRIRSGLDGSGCCGVMTWSYGEYDHPALPA